MTEEEAYHLGLGSDDSDDEENVENALRAANGAGGIDIPKVLTMEDFEELKKKTLSLVDPEWKRSRNVELLAKMLALESPSITPQVSPQCPCLLLD